MSSWSVLFGSGYDQALIMVCRVDGVFHELEEDLLQFLTCILHMEEVVIWITTIFAASN